LIHKAPEEAKETLFQIFVISL